MNTLQGRRVYPPEPSEDYPDPLPLEYQPGDYWYDPIAKFWMANCPLGWIGNLSAHNVTEHEDGTITVSPSILISKPWKKHEPKQWHGYLEHGVWREV